jgi:hypothetical protein
MRINLILFFLIKSALCFSQDKIEETIYFEANRYDLNKKEEAALNSIINEFKNYDVKQIYLSGHTDSDGSVDFNYELSKKRVKTIRNIFLNRGYQIPVTNTNYKGELNPKSLNDINTNKQKNRRVEISIIYEKEPTIISKKANAGIYTDTKAQSFRFSALEGVEFVGEEGTRIKIQPKSIVDSEGKEIQGEVSLQLKEYYLNSDIILSGLQTLSIEDSLLETAGMIYIKIFHNDLEVNLKKGETFEIEILNKKRLKAMDFFSKEENEDKWTKATIWAWEPQMKDDILEKFIFKSPKLGWINCDRFLNFEELVNINVQVSDTINTSVCIVFKSINSILNSSKEIEGYKFRKIPEGEEISIIAFKLIEGNYMYAQRDVSIKKNSNYSLDLKQVPENLFNKLIKQFN